MFELTEVPANLPPCLPGVETMEDSEEPSDTPQSDPREKTGDSEEESFRLDFAVAIIISVSLVYGCSVSFGLAQFFVL